jgi:hypothetical protein
MSARDHMAELRRRVEASSLSDDFWPDHDRRLGLPRRRADPPRLLHRPHGARMTADPDGPDPLHMLLWLGGFAAAAIICAASILIVAGALLAWALA